MAHNADFGIYAFCLDDRIKYLKVSKQSVRNPIIFNSSEYFKNAIGILKTGMEPEWIYIKVANHHFKYLEINPLHHTQEIVSLPKKKDTKDLDYANKDIWGELKIYIEPNYEFLMDILKYNLWVKVVHPEHVKMYVKRHLDMMVSYY